MELIAQREAAATATAEGTTCTDHHPVESLALAETELAALAITRKTLTRLTTRTEAATPVDATIASVAYQKILAAFTTAPSGMRARDVCLALGHDVTTKDTENMRAKLKRLVARDILTEAQPGLFTLAQNTVA